MSEERVTLDQIMSSRAPRTGSGASFDLTAKNPNNIPKAPETPATVAEPVAEAPAKQYKATAVAHGPVDLSNAQTVDIHQILPSKPAEASVENNPLMADLDAAIDREMGKISELHEAIFAKQDEERQAAEDAENVRTPENSAAAPVTVADEEDEDLGLYDDKDSYDDGVDDHHFPMQRVQHISIDDNSATSVQADPNTTTVPYNPVRSDTNMENMTATAVQPEHHAVDVTITPVEVEVEEDVAVDAVKPEIIPETRVAEGGPAESVDAVTPSFRILDNTPNDDLFDEEENEATEVETTDSEKILEDLKTEVKQKITPIRNKIDLASFTIAKKAQSAQKVMRLAVQTNRSVADWVMFTAERPISVTGLSGPEILKLNPENSGRNRLNTFRDMYRVIYDHLYDANKPEFETWLKQVRFTDLQHIYFALYMATFGGSNFVSYSCPNNKCNKVFIKDIEFKDMVKYADDAAKQKVQAILKLDSTTPSNDTYPVDLVQISDSYVFGLRAPSVWNVIMETASLSDKFLEKHGDLIDVVAYIDSVYYIDAENQTLVPIDTKPDPNDQAKTSARRIKVFYDIIQQLSSEEYFNLGAAIKNYDKPGEQVTYMIPACTCPDCATEIPANENISPDAMLFTRHQLAAIGNM